MSAPVTPVMVYAYPHGYMMAYPPVNAQKVQTPRSARSQVLHLAVVVVFFLYPARMHTLVGECYVDVYPTSGNGFVNCVGQRHLPIRAVFVLYCCRSFLSPWRVAQPRLVFSVRATIRELPLGWRVGCL